MSRQQKLGSGPSRTMCRAVAVAVAVVSPFVVIASASAAVPIGSSLTSNPGDFCCSGEPVTASHRSAPPSLRAAGGLTAPNAGVVVRWRVKAGTHSPPTRLRIIRPGGAVSQATAVVSGPMSDPASDTTTTFGVNPGLPIKAGDGIGIDLPYPGNVSYHAWQTAADMNVWLPRLQDGAAPRGMHHVAGDDLLLQADIEPDRDGDRLGDETQDGDRGCPLLNVSLLLRICL